MIMLHQKQLQAEVGYRPDTLKNLDCCDWPEDKFTSTGPQKREQITMNKH